MSAQGGPLKWGGYRLTANISLLFGEVPFNDRFVAAARAGFESIEAWWPFSDARPSAAEVDDFCGRISDAGLQLTGLNFFAGDMAAGERGIACDPARIGELEDSTAVVLQVARATGCRSFNLLYGQPDRARSSAHQRAAAIQSYRRAAVALAEVGGTVLVEPLARGFNGDYPLLTHRDVLQLIEEVEAPNIKMLLDTFHLAMNGVDVSRLADELAAEVGHVQLADAPGRGQPGSGELDWAAIGAALRRGGYGGSVAAEYRPVGSTADTLGWVDGGSKRAVSMMSSEMSRQTNRRSAP